MILLGGLNHKTANVGIREQFHFPKDKLPFYLRQLSEEPGVKEALILSTCNRVEVMVSMENEAPKNGEFLQEFFRAQKNIDPKVITDAVYVHTNDHAINHLFRVTSSLDSMVVGEPQILGQVKEAFRVAMDTGTTGPVLNRCLHRAFHVAKRVRTETGIARHSVSMSSIAVKLGAKIFDCLEDQVVLLVGAGEMIHETAEKLVRSGVSEILVTNRTIEKASQIASLFQGTTFFLEKLPAHLPRADIVITSTASVDPLITREIVEEAIKIRHQEPMFFIDLSVPRNIEEGIGDLENVYLYDVDDFSAICEDNYKKRQKEIRLAENIITDECEGFSTKLHESGVIPIITSLNQKAEGIAEKELERTLKKMPHLSSEDSLALKNMTRSIVKKFLHDPILELKDHAEKSPQDESFYQFIKRIFRL